MEIIQGTRILVSVITLFQLQRARELYNLELPVPQVLEGVRSIIFDDTHKNGIYYVARHNNQTIGCFLLTREKSDWYNKDYIWIQSIYINPVHRGHGVWKKMFNFIKEHYGDPINVAGFKLCVDINNINAQQAYANVGMIPKQSMIFEYKIG